jgi:hypothetical protein
MGIQLTDSAGWRLKQCNISLATARLWHVSVIMFLGSCLLNQKYKHSFSKGPLPLYKRHRITEPLLNGMFRAAQ